MSLHRPKVLFFDVNETLLDLKPLKASIQKNLRNEQNSVELWFTGLLHYSLVYSAGHHFEPFDQIGSKVLKHLAEQRGIKLSKEEARKAILEPMQSLKPHADVEPALNRLKKADYSLVALTNSSEKAVTDQFKNNGLIAYFDKLLSVEQFGKFKPYRELYHWASKQLNVKPEESMMIAAHDWDITGALWANWRAAFLKRGAAQLFPEAPQPEISVENLDQIATKLENY